MSGVTLATFRRYKPGATKADLRMITEADLEAIYRDGYWEPMQADHLPAGVDLVAFDAAVNSGPARSAKWLQAAAGLTGKKVDGKVGVVTLSAVSSMDPVVLVIKACEKRMGFLRGLKTWGTFGKGWSRRVADVEARAVAMIDAQRAAQEGQKAASKAKANGAAATGSAGAAGLSAAAQAADGAGHGGLVLIVVLALGVALVAHLRARRARERAEAYERVAAEVSA